MEDFGRTRVCSVLFLDIVEYSRREDHYTVRMRDGSSRNFDERPGVTWRVGERLFFIE